MKEENKKNILLVEDELIIAASEQLVLENNGYNVIIASSGEDAIRKVIEYAEIDLVLMDINLSKGIDGIQAAEKILLIRYLPIVFISGYIEREVIEKTEKISSFGYIVKDSGETVFLFSIKMAFRLFESIKKINEKERLLIESEKRFRNSFDKSPVGSVIVGLDKRFIRCNEAFCKFLGFKEEELINKTIGDVTHPEDIHIGMDELNLIIEGKLESSVVQKRYIRKDGKVVWGELSISSVRDSENKPLYFLPIIQDITQKKLNEIALQQSEERFRSLFNNMAQGVIYYNSDGRIYLANNSTSEILGIPGEKLAGKLISEFNLKAVHPDMTEFKREELPYLITIETGKAVKNVVMGVFNYSEDKYRWVLINSFPIFNQNDIKPNQVFVTFTDITKLKQANDEINKQLKNQEILLREAHHRIKNNIASILNLIFLKIESIENEEAKSILRDASLRIESMLVLYNKLLGTKDYKEISSKEYVESLIEVILSLFPNNSNIELNCRLMDFSLNPKQMFALGLIINELLTNIMKYAFNESDKGKIEVELSKKDSIVSLIIQDNGKGLPKGFVISDSKGLGLVLVEMLAEQLEAKISYENSLGLKTTLNFELK